MQCRNSAHFWHTGNTIAEAPHFDTDDNRLTAIEVLQVPENNRWTTEEARQAFKAEAPAILWTLLNWQLPAFDTGRGSDRTRIPVIQTNAKIEILTRRETALDVFLSQHFARQAINPADKARWKEVHRYKVQDADTYNLVPLGELYSSFREWAVARDEKMVGETRFTEELRERGLVVYRGWNNQTRLIAGLDERLEDK